MMDAKKLVVELASFAGGVEVRTLYPLLLSYLSVCASTMQLKRSLLQYYFKEGKKKNHFLLEFKFVATVHKN